MIKQYPIICSRIPLFDNIIPEISQNCKVFHTKSKKFENIALQNVENDK